MKPRHLIALSCLVGCASLSPGPPIAAMQADQRCHAWIDNGTGHASARVEHEQAILYGGFGETPAASFQPPGGNDIVVRGTVVGSYAPHSVALKGVAQPATLGADAATIGTGGGPLTVYYNRACSDRNAALGVASLFAGLASEHWH